MNKPPAARTLVIECEMANPPEKIWLTIGHGPHQGERRDMLPALRFAVFPT